MRLVVIKACLDAAGMELLVCNHATQLVLTQSAAQTTLKYIVVRLPVDPAHSITLQVPLALLASDRCPHSHLVNILQGIHHGNVRSSTRACLVAQMRLHAAALCHACQHLLQ